MKSEIQTTKSTKAEYRFVHLVSFVVLFLFPFFSGCSFSRPTLNKESFALTSPPLETRPSATDGPWLEIRRVTLAAPYDSQSFVYRTGEFSYERDPYAEFLVAPTDALEVPLRAYLAESGEFRGVLEPGSTVTPGVLAEVAVDQLYGDFRDRAKPVAVLELTFAFVDAANNGGGKVLLRKTYEQRIPLKARTAAALVAGWNEALKQIMNAVANDWRAAAGHKTSGN